MIENSNSIIEKLKLWYDSNIQAFYASVYLGIIITFIFVEMLELSILQYTIVQYLILFLVVITSFIMIQIYIEFNNKVFKREIKFIELWVIPFSVSMYLLLMFTKPEINNFFLKATKTNSHEKLFIMVLPPGFSKPRIV